MNISVIIPTLHSPIIRDVIASLDQQTARSNINEIIVVGQCKPDHVIPPARFIPTNRPVAAAVARNIGAQAASGDVLLFIDSDCIAHPCLVDFHLALHKSGQMVVGGSIAIETNDNYWRLCDNLLSFTPFLSTMPAGERAYLPSLNLSIRRSIFMAIGGFDERFGEAAGEDIDFSLRLRLHGHQLFFAPNAKVYHRPQRVNARTVAHHLRSFGRIQVVLHRRHHLLGQSLLPERLRPWAGLLLSIAPLLATLDTLRLYHRYPQLRPFWHCLPGIVLGKSAWYWGYSEVLLLQERNKRNAYECAG